eukprot:544882-Prorocentrum_minimum.AAC.1
MVAVVRITSLSGESGGGGGAAAAVGILQGDACPRGRGPVRRRSPCSAPPPSDEGREALQ